MYDIFREEDFKARKDPMKNWVVLLNEESKNTEYRIELYNPWTYYSDETVASNIVDLVHTSITCPYLLPLGKIMDDNFFYRKPCALIAGSKTGGALNRIATQEVLWNEVLDGDEDGDALRGPFAISGPAVVVKVRKDGALTTFTRKEALEIAAILSTDVNNCKWDFHTKRRVLEERQQRKAEKREKRKAKKGKKRAADR